MNPGTISNSPEDSHACVFKSTILKWENYHFQAKTLSSGFSNGSVFTGQRVMWTPVITYKMYVLKLKHTGVNGN